MVERRVVVTGIGMVSPLGIGYDTFCRGLFAGRHGIGPITRFDASRGPARMAGEVQGFTDDMLPGSPRQKVVLSRAMKYGLVAAGEALAAAGLTGAPDVRARTACLMAVSRTEFTLDDFAPAFARSMKPAPEAASGYRFDRNFFCARGARAAHPMWLLKFIPNLAVAHVVRSFDLGGETNTYTAEAAASARMLGDAASSIREGRYDVALCGASDSRLNPIGVARYGSLDLLAPGGPDDGPQSMPFDRDRRGYVIGECAVFLVLEALDHAEGRGAAPIAELVGWGGGSDAFHPIRAHPEGRGLVSSMAQAMTTARITAADVDAVVAAAASLPDADAAEGIALRTVFGEARPAVTAPAGALGRTHVAVGALNAAVAVAALAARAVPPTAGTANPDELAPAGLVIGPHARSLRVRTALANAYSFGGQCASLVFREVS